LERIQFSAFMGRLNRNHREALIPRLKNEVATSLARVRVIPVCEEDVKSMWLLDQYCLPEEAREEGALPRLRIIAAD
jgi:CRISPR-associated endonuclease Cas2